MREVRKVLRKGNSQIFALQQIYSKCLKLLACVLWSGTETSDDLRQNSFCPLFRAVWSAAALRKHFHKSHTLSTNQDSNFHARFASRNLIYIECVGPCQLLLSQLFQPCQAIPVYLPSQAVTIIRSSSGSDLHWLLVWAIWFCWIFGCFMCRITITHDQPTRGPYHLAQQSLQLHLGFILCNTLHSSKWCELWRVHRVYEEARAIRRPR